MQVPPGRSELIAAHPDGCIQAVLAAENISADVLIEVLCESGLATARIDRIDEQDGVLEVTKLRITEAGMRVRAARR